MKWIFISIAAAGIIGLGFISKMNKPSGTASKKINLVAGTYAPVALLELFTSEGCSSCPPADNLLPQLAKLDSGVIALSFHVDYWNRLGWTDPFSKSEFSERQREYSRQFSLESIYTPQLVVNGEYEFVGSSRGKAEETIKKVLKEKTLVRINIDNVTINENKLNFIVHAEGDWKKTDLVAALVQKNAMMNVKAGENSGAKLSHTNVVRYFKKQAAAEKTGFELEIPAGLDANNWQLIVFAQQKSDLKITGAVLYNPDQK